MKKVIPILLVLITNFAFSQEAIHNYGTMQMHSAVSVGFHMDLINDGTFDQNLGLAGFYGFNRSLTVSGANSPIFYDAEIVVDDGLYLDTGIGVLNNGNLVTGDIITPRFDTGIFTNFIDDAFYVGENDISLVDGYAALTNKDAFMFPVGDAERLRPLTINSLSTNALAKCAYFYESPNSPSTFGKSFQVASKESEFLSVSPIEFWHLEGDIPSTVTLTWDDRSDMSALADQVDEIKVVGWHRVSNEWVDLGNDSFQGTLDSGSVTSITFTPNDYELLTLGGRDLLQNEFETIQLDNYFITPNSDGQNDFLVLDGIENSPNNELKIFNRYGVLVYSKKNYQNEFHGISNRNVVISRNTGLPSGVYFYITTLMDVRQRHQGYMYISTTE